MWMLAHTLVRIHSHTHQNVLGSYISRAILLKF